MCVCVCQMTEPMQYYICRILYLTFKTLVHD